MPVAETTNWKCKGCNTVRLVSTAHERRHIYCSIGCGLKFNSIVFRSYSDRPKKPPQACLYCGKDFSRPGFHNKYCSTKCSSRAISPKNAVKARAARVPRGSMRDCVTCLKSFYATDPPSQAPRKFCSWSCFVISENAFKGSPMRYGLRKDLNHWEITALLDQLGIGFVDMSALGRGVPDLVVGLRGIAHLWEIKNPQNSYGKRGLNKNQIKWAENWRGSPVYVISSEDDALRFINGERNHVKSFGCVSKQGEANAVGVTNRADSRGDALVS
jgi:hypothetical protein